MKIPASSSIFLATLAISSSSSCLAAPTGDSSTGHGISSSSSSSHVDGPPSDGHVQPRAEGNLEGRDLNLLQGIKGTLTGLPVVGPVLNHVLDTNNPSQQDLAALQAAADEVTRALGAVSNSTLPAPVKDAAGQVGSQLPGPAAGALNVNPDGDASASAAPPSQTASAAAADAPSSAAQPSGSASPPMPPPGPPNTPTLPVNV